MSLIISNETQALLNPSTRPEFLAIVRPPNRKERLEKNNPRGNICHGGYKGLTIPLKYHTKTKGIKCGAFSFCKQLIEVVVEEQICGPIPKLKSGSVPDRIQV